MTRASACTRKAPAKLNLTLAVIRRLDSGYHALHSVMAPLALADDVSLRVKATPGARSRRGEQAGPTASPPAEERPVPSILTSDDTLAASGFDAGAAADNLVLRAIRATRVAIAGSWQGAPDVPPPLAARLVKRIPVAAGLGGGSSDAASAMDAALEAWDATLPADVATAVAASLGSDVPFFLAGGAALVTGRGESVVPLRGVVGEPPGILLVTPRIAVSTAAVYATYAGGARPYVGGAARMASEHLAAELQRGLTAQQLLDRAGALATANDLIAATIAIVPPLLSFRRGLARLLGRPIAQSGSGPTAWVRYASIDEAKDAARLVKAAYRDGTLPAVGDGEPFVAATTLLVREAAAA